MVEEVQDHPQLVMVDYPDMIRASISHLDGPSGGTLPEDGQELAILLAAVVSLVVIQLELLGDVIAGAGSSGRHELETSWAARVAVDA
jgi:hypothetical protein